MMKKRIECAIFFLAMTIMLLSCGSQAELYPDGKPGEKGNLLSFDAEGNSVYGRNCEDKEIEVTGEWMLDEISKIPASRLKLTVDGKEIRLCEIMIQEKKRAMILQFAGVLCYSCQDEAKYINENLTLKNLRDEILHVVVITDFLEDYSEEEFRGFMQQYAPQGFRSHDPTIELWRYFSIDPTMPTRPTFVALNLDGDAKVINEEHADFEVIIDFAIELTGKYP